MSKRNNFRLESVLNYKTSMVDNLEAEFTHLKAIQKSEEEALHHLETIVSQHTASLKREQEQGLLNCQTIELHQRYLRFLSNHVDRQKIQAVSARMNAENKREELIKMMQDQKTLEKLREKHLTKEALALNRQESRVVDDLVTTRYAREGYSHV